MSAQDPVASSSVFACIPLPFCLLQSALCISCFYHLCPSLTINMYLLLPCSPR